MAQCTMRTGFLLWKKPCAGVAVGHCGNCKRLVCRQHFVPQSDGPFLCPDCVPAEDDDSSAPIFASSATSAVAAAAEREPAGPDSSDSGSSDSGSSDSGSSDSGSSDSSSSSSD